MISFLLYRILYLNGKYRQFWINNDFSSWDAKLLFRKKWDLLIYILRPDISKYYSMVSGDLKRGNVWKSTCNNLIELQPCVCLRKPSERHRVSICIVIGAGFAHKIYNYLWIEAKFILAYSWVYMKISLDINYLWIKECWCNEILWGNFHNTRFISLIQSFRHQGI